MLDKNWSQKRFRFTTSTPRSRFEVALPWTQKEGRYDGIWTQMGAGSLSEKSSRVKKSLGNMLSNLFNLQGWVGIFDANLPVKMIFIKRNRHRILQFPKSLVTLFCWAIYMFATSDPHNYCVIQKHETGSNERVWAENVSSIRGVINPRESSFGLSRIELILPGDMFLITLAKGTDGHTSTSLDLRKLITFER